MTIKSLLFCLFLYVCLVWVIAAYLYSGSTADIVHYGLLWTAIGLIVVLVSIVGSLVFSWWRIRRAKSAARPPAPAKQPAPANPEDEGLMALLAEANAALAKSPAFVEKRGVTPLSTMPWYLLVGPEGTGKTSSLINSGLEPILLAGQVAGSTAVIPTRLCNLWLAKGGIFAELGGRLFSGDISRWSQLLRMLRGSATLPIWRRAWGERAPQTDLHGVIAFCDSSEFTGASSDPQRLERSSRDWQARLGAIAEAFGLEVPVYLVLTKCDKIKFFSDFFRRLPDPEAGQILGCTLPYREPGTADPEEVFAEAEAKRLTASFRPLYHALAERRLTQLTFEPDPGQRPSIYEFPRELKRIRSPLVQFLTDVFRAHSLGPRPVLRGYYLTATREGYKAPVDLGATRTADSIAAPIDATGLFRGDTTRLFTGDDLSKGPAGAGGRNSGPAWMFVTDLFHKVVLRDQIPRKVQPLSGSLDRLHTWTFRALTAVCALLCFAFVVSWVRNRELLNEVAAASASVTGVRRNPATLADLQSLDRLAAQIVRLEGSLGLSYHWGLYSGDRVLPQARRAYFRRFHDLLLIDLNSAMASDLEGLPAAPGEGAPYEPVYRTLRAHLMITARGCPVDPTFLSRSLKEFRPRIAPGTAADWQAMADRQIEFYVNESRYDELPRLPEDASGREHARDYLRKMRGGIESVYAAILAATEKSVSKPLRLEELAPNYTRVLAGPESVSAAFSPAGWTLVEKASKESNVPTTGDPCVVGENAGVVAGIKQNAETAHAVQRMYFRDYAERWRKFVEGFSVIRFTSAEDAARKLEILADHKSPLLALLVLTANQTNFPAAPGQAESLIDKVAPSVNKLLGSAKKAEDQAKSAFTARTDGSDAFTSPADITRFFQPVHWVEPPTADTWVGERTQAYIEALQQLGRSLHDIAQPGMKDPAVYQTASQSYDKGIQAVRQIANGFKPVGVGSLDVTVQHLLEAPIRLTSLFMAIPDPSGPVNAELRKFCSSQRGTFTKYPFQSSPNDASLDEFANVFDPVKGQFWKYQQQSLAEYVVKEGSQWKPKDPAKKPQVTPEMLAFLNRAQQIRDAFYPAGATQPGFYYSLLPKLDSRLKNATLELRIDGVPHEWTTALRHQFAWPAPKDAKDPGAVAALRIAGTGVPFVSQGGIWGIFRILGDAEPRDLNAKQVEWKYSSRGRREPMDVPVQLEIVDFPSGIDVFNPRFWQAFRCPAVAVQ